MTDEELLVQAYQKACVPGDELSKYVAGLRAVAAAARREALEEAALECDLKWAANYHAGEPALAHECERCAAAIRVRAGDENGWSGGEAAGKLSTRQ